MLRRVRTLVPAILVAALVLAATPARAALPPTQPDDTGMLNGKVRSLEQAGGHIWIGGAFTEALNASGQVPVPVSALAAFDPATGLLDPGVNQPLVTNGATAATVYDLSLGPDGKLYIAGRFTAVNGQPRRNAAAIDPVTGALLAFDPKPAEARAIYASASAVFVGTTKVLSYGLDGTPTAGFTAPEVFVDPSLRAGHVTPPQIRDLARVGDHLIAACQCDSLTDAKGTRTVKAVVKIDATSGDWIDWRPTGLPDSSGAFGINLILHDAPGGGPLTIYLAGGGSDFTGAYNESTGQQRWKTDTSGSSQAVAWYQGSLIVGGHFNWVESPTSGSCNNNDVPNLDCYHAPKLAAMDPDDGRVILDGAAPWNPGICCVYNGVWALLTDADGSHLHVGGEFKRAGGTWSGSGITWVLSGYSKQQYYARFTGSPTGQATLALTKDGAGAGTVVSTPGGIDCGSTCTADFAVGTSVTLTAQAAQGSVFQGWSGDCSGTGSCNVTLSGSRSVTASFGSVVVARCGSIAFVSARRGAGDIFTMTAAGDAVLDVSDDPAPDRDPAWSPDCSQIAFSSTRNGSGDIFVMDADGSNVRVVTSGTGNDIQPSWSPDGQRIAFTGDAAGNRELYVVNTDGSSRTRITTNAWVDQQPDWSPDGTKLVFASNRDDVMQLFTLWPDGSHRRQLTSGLRANDQPAWSPNGSRISYVSRSSGTPQIWIANANGTGRTRVSKGGKSDSHPSWSPNGTRLTYASNASGVRQIWIITSGGKSATKLTAHAVGNSAPDWS